jgi:hypothetical protein
MTGGGGATAEADADAAAKALAAGAAELTTGAADAAFAADADGTGCACANVIGRSAMSSATMEALEHQSIQRGLRLETLVTTHRVHSPPRSHKTKTAGRPAVSAS